MALKSVCKHEILCLKEYIKANWDIACASYHKLYGSYKEIFSYEHFNSLTSRGH